MAGTDTDRFEKFSSVLRTELLERSRKNLELLIPDGDPAAPLPFAMTRAFIEIYPEIFKVGIFPLVVSRRPVRAIQGDVDWDRDGREYLQTVLDDRSNAVFIAWDAAWDAVWSERRVTVADHVSSSAGGEERKGGLLGFLFGRKDAHKSAEERAAEAASEPEIIEGMGTMLQRFAEKHGAVQPLPDDVKLFKGLIRMKPPRLAAAIKELRQHHDQEFVVGGEDKAKPGTLSEALQKWHYNLPERIGEFVVVRAAVDLENLDKTFLAKYIRQSARTQEEAERGMPYVAAYCKAMRNRR